MDDVKLRQKNIIALFRSPTFLLRWIGILLSIAFLLWILHSFDLTGVANALQSANYLFLLPAAMVLVLDYIFRSYRWGILFDDRRKVGRSSLFIAYMIGFLANNILPARSGDLVRAYILGQREEISKTTTFATILVERVADLLVTLFLIPVTLIFFPVSEWLTTTAIVIAVVGFTGSAILFLIGRRGRDFVNRIPVHFLSLPIGFRKLFKKLADNFIIGVSGMHTKRKYLAFICYTAMIWILEVCLVWLMAKLFSLPLTFGGALFVLLSIALGMAIPASPGSLGTYEFFATNALILLGVSGGNTLGFALLMHVTTYLGGSFIGVICMIWNSHKLGFPEVAEDKVDIESPPP